MVGRNQYGCIIPAFSGVPMEGRTYYGCITRGVCPRRSCHKAGPVHDSLPRGMCRPPSNQRP